MIIYIHMNSYIYIYIYIHTHAHAYIYIYIYEGRLKNSQADQETLMDCDQMLFIFQYSSPNCQFL